MSDNIINELPALLKANVITEETAQKIKDYFTKKAMKARTSYFRFLEF